MPFLSLKFTTPWRRWLVYWLLILPAVYLLYMAVMYFFQDRFIFPGAGRPTLRPPEFGLSVEEITLKTPDGATLACWFIPGRRDPAPAANPAASPTSLPQQPCAIWFEGNAENRGDRLPQIQYWHRMGVACFIYDYRGYGDSTGRVTCHNARADALQVLQYVLARPDVDPAHVILNGHSIGSGIAGTLLPDFTPAAIVLEAPFSSLVEAAQDNAKLLPTRWLLRDNYNTAEKLQAYPGPVLIMASRKDELFNPEHAHRLHRAGKNATLVWDDGAHADQRQGPMYADTIEAFLIDNAVIPPPPQPPANIENPK